MRDAGRRRGPWAAFALLCVAMAAACGLSADADQARICRSVAPALHPDARVNVLRIEPGVVPRSLRVDYEVVRVDRSPFDRSVQCVFASEGLSLGKAELVRVITLEGPLSEASLYFLRRFYLETPEGVIGDPGGVPDADVVAVPQAVAYSAQQILQSLPRTAIYALLAAAYALVFGLAGRINLAFGELAAIGSAATVSGAALAVAGGMGSPAAGLIAGLFCAVFAGALYSAVGGHFTLARIRSASPQPSLIATVGLSLVLMEYLRLVQSPVTVWLPPVWTGAVPLMKAGSFLVSVTAISVVTTLTGVVAALGLVALMRGTRFGRAWRACADDARAAALFGVDVRRLLRTTLALSGAMAGLAGMLIVVQYGGLGFAGGLQFGLKALIAAIVGGIGSVTGALLGGVAIGVFETLWSAYLPIDGRDIALFTALVAFLIFRPGGLLGAQDATPRPV
jgi:branched-subunit amino acid ABC-type transport system permease component